MAVLVEAISVIVLRDAIVEKYLNGWSGFLADIPNRTFCDDGEVVRIGFMDGADAMQYINVLKSNGLSFVDGERYVDIAVIDQVKGLKLQCDWLDFNIIAMLNSDIKILKCSLKGSSNNNVYLPEGWTYHGSISENVKNNNSKFKFVRIENGSDVYVDLITGERVYVGRTVK